nr:hypothetical protein BSM_13870 [uncultured archaeon]
MKVEAPLFLHASFFHAQKDFSALIAQRINIFKRFFFITAKNQPDRGIITLQSLLFLELAHIKVHLPDVLMRERTNLQTNKHKTFFLHSFKS